MIGTSNRGTVMNTTVWEHCRLNVFHVNIIAKLKVIIDLATINRLNNSGQSIIKNRKQLTMKRVFVSLSLTLIVGITMVFANGKSDVNDKINESFKKEFSGAESVKWNKVEDYQRADFFFHGHRAIAYFSDNGEFLGSARDILFDELPLAVIRSLDKHYDGADLIEINEIFNIEGTSYWLTVERQNKQYRIKVNTQGEILKVIKK